MIVPAVMGVAGDFPSTLVTASASAKLFSAVDCIRLSPRESNVSWKPMETLEKWTGNQPRARVLDSQVLLNKSGLLLWEELSDPVGIVASRNNSSRN